MALYEQLPCNLTEEEMLERGKSLVANIDTEIGLESDKKSYTERHKESIAALASERRTIGRAIKTGQEMRSVEVEEIRDYKRGMVAIVRTDTSTLVRERPMDEGERQAALDLAGLEGLPGKVKA